MGNSRSRNSEEDLTMYLSSKTDNEVDMKEVEHFIRNSGLVSKISNLTIDQQNQMVRVKGTIDVVKLVNGIGKKFDCNVKDKI
ncbi:hypothetical protein Q3G72_012871 [Acer saccharum]|nr:hypothetical protein Q3G72_012871 [Acer saccharum]